MEKHKCKLCSKSFKCGRALGGHMRSHFMSLPVPLPPKTSSSSHFQAKDGFESWSSSSEDDEEKKDSFMVYGLRENPRRSVNIVDRNPEVSSIAAAGSVVVLQDRESETEDSKKNYKKNPCRKRSRRVKQWKEINQQQQKLRKLSSWEEPFFTEPEPLSSVSDTSPEEDVAMCLIMLSRDKWMKNLEEEELENYSAAVADDEDEENLESKYKCETCNKVFQSYQALGGHKASHKKSKVANFQVDEVMVMQQGTKSSGLDMKIHECSLCYKVFGSGQALGGHKRAHLLSSASVSSSVIAASASAAAAAAADGEDDKCTVQLGGGGASDGGNGCIVDLNLPPPMEDEEDNINYRQLVRLSLLSQF